MAGVYVQVQNALRQTFETLRRTRCTPRPIASYPPPLRTNTPHPMLQAAAAILAMRCTHAPTRAWA